MKLSAGLLVFRNKKGLEVFVVHPGGPFFARKDSWGIPKGEYSDDEDPAAAAKREFEEETGLPAPQGELIALGEVKTSSKLITAWAVEGDVDAAAIKSNSFEMEWPPRSGKMIDVAEIDKAAWMPAGKALGKMHKGQDEFIVRLMNHLGMPKEDEQPVQGSLF